MKNRKIFEKVMKSLKNIAGECINNEREYIKCFTIFEIYDELNQKVYLKAEEMEELCDYVYDIYISVDDNSITIPVIVDTIEDLLEDDYNVAEITEMTESEFVNNIWF